MQRLPSLDKCLLCGTCVCPPSDDILIDHQGTPGDRDFVHEDEVTWLKTTRIVVAFAGRDQLYPSALTEDAYLTGIAYKRKRNDQESRFEFTRGSAIDLDFGPGTKSIRGEGPLELISVPRNTLKPPNIRTNRIYSAIHERCRLILARVQLWSKQVDLEQDPDGPLDIRPDLVNRLVWYFRSQPQTHCSSPSAWMEVLDSEEIEETEEEIDAEPRMPKACFTDPCSEEHITRLRPFLAFKPTATSLGRVEKYNDHLDHWQRALLLVKPSYDGDPLSKLPTEILMHIASFLSARETRLLCYASNATAWKLNQAGLWFNRLNSDMPWLWDVTIERVLEEQMLAYGSQSQAEIDWQAIYFDLQEQSIYNSRKKTLTLVNRRRIWNKCLAVLQMDFRAGET